MTVTLHQEEMLLRNFPKFGSFLVNPAPKFDGIDLDIQVHEPRFGLCFNLIAAIYNMQLKKL